MEEKNRLMMSIYQLIVIIMVGQSVPKSKSLCQVTLLFFVSASHWLVEVSTTIAGEICWKASHLRPDIRLTSHGITMSLITFYDYTQWVPHTQLQLEQKCEKKSIRIKEKSIKISLNNNEANHKAARQASIKINSVSDRLGRRMCSQL